MRKKPKLKYTEMCIYIDKNINNPNADVNKIYEYLVMVTYMLSVKRRFFNREDYYDQFAHYFATLVYNRMTDKRQFLDETDKNYIKPIRSCLNYMKHIIYAKKCEFCNEEFNFITQSSDADVFNGLKDCVYQPVNATTDDLLRVDIDRYFNTIEKMVRGMVYQGVYAKDKVLC